MIENEFNKIKKHGINKIEGKNKHILMVQLSLHIKGISFSSFEQTSFEQGLHSLKSV